MAEADIGEGFDKQALEVDDLITSNRKPGSEGLMKFGERVAMIECGNC
jgi:hypothetical protein